MVTDPWVGRLMNDITSEKNVKYSIKHTVGLHQAKVHFHKFALAC